VVAGEATWPGFLFASGRGKPPVLLAGIGGPVIRSAIAS
jgi:hypothetical protein